MGISSKTNSSAGFQARLLGFTAFLVTTFFWSQGTDPFNLPKLFVLTLGAFALAGSTLSNIKQFNLKTIFVPELAASGLLILGLLISFIFSSAPKSQMFYGAYARNTGLLCYLSLLVIYICSASLKNIHDLQLILKLLVAASIVAMGISLLEISGVNVQGVDTNINMALISTFGNSNFISAFLGMSGIVFFTIYIGFKLDLWKKFVLIILYLSCILLILKSDSKQGLIVLLAGCGINFGFYILLKWKRRVFKISYFSLLLVSGLLAFLGFIDKGPLATLIYKNSVGFRFEYWKAGIEMFKSHPITGVGLNSYGDWYRTLRSAGAMISPGVDVITNTSHSVYIDLASTGGIFLISGFVALILFSFRAAYKVVFRSKEFDVIFYSMLGAWLAYLLQAAISIDQIGLSIWGWILAGGILAYERISASEKSEMKSETRKNLRNPIKTSRLSTSNLVGTFAGIIVATLVILPALQADFNLRKTFGSKTLDPYLISAEEWPQDSFRSARIASILLNSKLNLQALEITREGLRRNPRAFDLWNLTYLNPEASFEERSIALSRMKALDPRNTIVGSKVVEK